MIKVIAGSRRSLPLKTLDGDDITKPTRNMIRETLFNCLQMDVPGSRFLDLFSGCGAIGIEALSRGAESAVLVEANKAALEVIKYNVHFTKFDDEADIVRADAVSYLRKMNTVDFDIIHLDPPYMKGFERACVEALNTKEFSNPDAVIVIECEKNTDFDFIENTKFRIYKTKIYSINKHIFLCLK